MSSDFSVFHRRIVAQHCRALIEFVGDRFRGIVVHRPRESGILGIHVIAVLHRPNQHPRDLPAQLIQAFAGSRTHEAALQRPARLHLVVVVIDPGTGGWFLRIDLVEHQQLGNALGPDLAQPDLSGCQPGPSGVAPPALAWTRERPAIPTADLLGAWGSATVGPDINGNGIVDGQDLGILLGNWGGC